ncbi:helix-turn-helix transcriptional regulator [Bacillus sp. BRMEA1]|uniref:helix-turn-helix domain-containing protein n=1 Tax=Neobacillus endophyticus TaxID=2738405 RepID=UPI00156791B8|nr:helix-turn-helix domain-containing protein [Neobacillus endophyticus]NRD76200.1 helix-turn-helix transcriptional regulator [Neobacillus endophyticus]
MEFFGGWLKQKRKEKNLSGRKLAEKIEMSPSYIAQLEVGHIKQPSVSVGRKIMDILDIENPEEVLIRFGILEKKDRLRYLFEMDEVIEKENMIQSIKSDLDHMDLEQLNSLYISMNKYRDILMNIGVLEKSNQNSNKNNPVNAIREFVEFLITKYKKEA